MFTLITAGITQLKDICYEVKTGFLPDNAIVEMVTNVNEDISQDNIVIKRYRFFNSTQRLQHFSIHYWNTIQIFIL
jgi:hypothetical protein